MANYSALIKVINNQIKANGNQEITGPVLNAVLRAMVSALGEGYQFMGIATPDTNPGTPDGKVFYIATEPGVYSNFGVIVPNGSIGIISNTSGDWEVNLINTYYEIDVDTLMQDSPSSDDIDKAIGSLSNLRRAITVGVPFVGRSASGRGSTVAIAQVKQLSDTEVRVVMLNTGTVDGSNELVPIIKKITNSAGQLSLSTEAPTSFIGPLSSLSTSDKGSVVKAINEVYTGLKYVIKPYVVDLTSLLSAQDSESISTAIGGIDNLNGTVQKNQVIFGTLANGTVAVGIRVLGNQTTLTYFVDSVVGLTVNEVIITNTSGTLTKTVNTHAVITENMVVNNLESDETTLPLSAAQGKALSEEVKSTYQKITDNTLATTAKTVVGAINEVKSSVDVNSYKQYLHKVYEEYGAVYNKETGYWEYGDLKDMTEEDCFLAAFYALEQIQGDSRISYILDRFGTKQARTYFTKISPKGGYNATKLILNSCFAQCSNLEYLKLSTESTSLYLSINDIEGAFRSCTKLRKIEDILSIYNMNRSSVEYAFSGCRALRDVKVRIMSDANAGVSFQYSPLLSYESLNYLVTNAANTKAITVTVHPTTYSYLTGTAQPTEEVGGTTEEWQALVTIAQGKQISFAQPAETLEVEPLE